jgi:hypothetical protein
MAFVPDDAEDRFHELSPSAERFYIYLCKTRNHKMQLSFGTIEACAARYEWKRATKFAVVKELISKGWIEHDGYAWKILVGDFSPVNKSKNLDSQSENLDYQSKKSDSESKNLDSHIRNIPALPEIEPEEELSYESLSNKPKYQTQISEVFEFWKTETDHPKTFLDKKRKAKIMARLHDGYSVEDLKKAILGNRGSPWHNGTDQKSNGTVYDSIDLIFRDSEKVDFFININKNGVKQNGTDKRFSNNADKRLEAISETDQRIAELLAEGERERLQSEHYGIIEAHSPSC